MKFNCDKITLINAVSNVMKSVSSRSTLPVLEGILLKAYKNKIKLIGYNLEMGITTEINANIIEEGEIILSANYLFSIIKKMPEDVIVITSDDKQRTTIESGISTFNILGMPSDDYPAIPELSENNNLFIKNSILKNMIDMTLFCVATNDTRPVQTGSLFEINNSQITLVSVDGFRLALRRENINLNQDIKYKFIVPAKTLSEVSHLIDFKFDKENEKMVNIKFSDKHAIFEIEEYTIFTRLLEGEFLDYKNSIPQTKGTEIFVNTKLFIDSIERVSLLITEKLKSPLRCVFEENCVKISCVTTVGRSYDEISCEIVGEQVDIGFNSKYLIDSLKASGEDNIRLEINGPLSPIKILPIDKDNFIFLVLPMRLKNEI